MADPDAQVTLDGDESHLAGDELTLDGASLVMDGEVIAEGASDDDVIEADAQALRLDAAVVFPEGHGTEPIYTVDIDRNGVWVVSGGGDDGAVVWVAATGEVMHRLEGHTDSVVSVAFSADGSLVATGGLDGSVFVWDPVSGEQVAALEGPSEVEFLRWHPRGPVLVAGSTDGLVWMWHAVSGKMMNVFTGHADVVSDARFTPDGKQLVSVSVDASLIVWNPKTAEVIQKVSGYPFHEAPINTLSVGQHPPGSQTMVAVTGAQDGTVCVVVLESGRVVHSFVGQPRVEDLVWDDGGAEEQGSGDAEVSDDDADANDAAHAQQEGGEEDQTGLHAPEGGTDNAAEGRSALPEAGPVHRASVESVGLCASDAHPWMASADLDGIVMVRDLSSGDIRHHLVHAASVIRCVWHPDLPLLFTLCMDGAVRAWDARTGENIVEKYGHTDAPLDMGITGGVSEAASAADAEAAEDVEIPNIAPGTVLLVTGGDDSTGYLWLMDQLQ